MRPLFLFALLSIASFSWAQKTYQFEGKTLQIELPEIYQITKENEAVPNGDFTFVETKLLEEGKVDAFLMTGSLMDIDMTFPLSFYGNLLHSEFEAGFLNDDELNSRVEPYQIITINGREFVWINSTITEKDETQAYSFDLYFTLVDQVAITLFVLYDDQANQDILNKTVHSLKIN